MNTISERLRATQKRIESACADYPEANRLPESVTLLAVSKTKPVEDILAAASAGQDDFGENYLQEAIEKIHLLRDKNLSWHYIGAIQSNKTKPIAEHFTWVHGVAELKHAKRLSNQRPTSLPKLNICLQVNIDEEVNKSGITPDIDVLLTLVKEIGELDNINLRGLMVIPSADNDKVQMRDAFRRTRKLFEQIQASGGVGDEFDTLSMGMSDDLDIAIAEGATIVRVGTAIFGKRDYQN